MKLKIILRFHKEKSEELYSTGLMLLTHKGFAESEFFCHTKSDDDYLNSKVH